MIPPVEFNLGREDQKLYMPVNGVFLPPPPVNFGQLNVQSNFQVENKPEE
jgi:hypothetical protein